MNRLRGETTLHLFAVMVVVVFGLALHRRLKGPSVLDGERANFRWPTTILQERGKGCQLLPMPQYSLRAFAFQRQGRQVFERETAKSLKWGKTKGLSLQTGP